MVANHWPNDGTVMKVFQRLHQPLVSMVFGLATIASDGFSIVFNGCYPYWSNDGMVRNKDPSSWSDQNNSALFQFWKSFNINFPNFVLRRLVLQQFLQF